jgi:hypothetical protein
MQESKGLPRVHMQNIECVDGTEDRCFGIISALMSGLQHIVSFLSLCAFAYLCCNMLSSSAV